MSTLENVRNTALRLSNSERALLAHELILSLDDPSSFDLNPDQEDEIQRRLLMVRDGTASGEAPGEVYATICAN